MVLVLGPLELVGLIGLLYYLMDLGALAGLAVGLGFAAVIVALGKRLTRLLRVRGQHAGEASTETFVSFNHSKHSE